MKVEAVLQLYTPSHQCVFSAEHKVRQISANCAEVHAQFWGLDAGLRPHLGGGTSALLGGHNQWSLCLSSESSMVQIEGQKGQTSILGFPMWLYPCQSLAICDGSLCLRTCDHFCQI